MLRVASLEMTGINDMIYPSASSGLCLWHKKSDQSCIRTRRGPTSPRLRGTVPPDFPQPGTRYEVLGTGLGSFGLKFSADIRLVAGTYL